MHKIAAMDQRSANKAVIPNQNSEEFSELAVKLKLESLKISLDAARQYVRFGVEALVCLAAIGGSVYSATLDKDLLAYLLACVPVLYVIKSYFIQHE